MNNPPLPAFGVCGWSRSGKTTLVVEIVRHFVARGLKVAVVKHAAHGTDAGREGKDSDRIFSSGAGMVLLSPGQRADRSHGSDVASLSIAVDQLDARHDLVLVEGYKAVNLAREVWLQREATEPCPPRVQGFTACSGRMTTGRGSLPP
jgi:molybdopterin-guanine dinucleotide biosynthesis protein B